MLRRLQTGHPHNPAGLLHRLSGYPRRMIGLPRHRGHRRSPTSTPYRCRHVLRWSSWWRWASETGNATSSCWRSTVPTCRGSYRSSLRTSTTGTSPGTECQLTAADLLRIVIRLFLTDCIADATTSTDSVA